MKRWWGRWRDVVYRLLAWFVSFGGLVAIALPHLPRAEELPTWSIAVGVVSVAALAVVVILELQSVSGHRVFDLSDREGIRNYMHGWIRHGGRVAIWTRDMSWAQDDETIGLLEEKARAQELVVCLPEPIALTDRLSKLGADVHPYGGTTAVPSARFTITFLDRDGARVAVGRTVKDEHVIDEFDSRTDPAFFIANDLINLARRLRNAH